MVLGEVDYFALFASNVCSKAFDDDGDDKDRRHVPRCNTMMAAELVQWSM